MCEKTFLENEYNSIHFRDINCFETSKENLTIEDYVQDVIKIQSPNSPNYQIQENPNFYKNSENDIASKDNGQNENKIISDIQFGEINFKKLSKDRPKNKNKVPHIYEENDSTFLNTKKKYTKKKINKKKINLKNLKTKVKRLIINVMILYSNNIIMKVYGNKIGEGVINKKIIRKINPLESNNITIAHNKILLKKTLREILSTDISERYTSVIQSNINEKIINDLLNEENEDKRQIFNDLFNKTFSDWILMLSNPVGELKDLYEKVLYKGKKKDENEIYLINQIIKNFESEFLNIK